MNPFIESMKVNLFDGIFNIEVQFQNGFNILSGENGTGKTKLIEQLKSGSERKFSNNQVTDRIVVFNPLRNAEKRTQEQIAQRLRSQDLNLKKINDVLKGFAINDWQLTTYYSFGEIFVLTYEDLLQGGGITIENAVNQTRGDFNKVLKQVFPQYEISAEWKNKQLSLSVRKFGLIEVPLNSLSRGESEALALLFNVYANREHEDIFLIDEPELHLNWDLEGGLFRFLNWFCKKHSKQVIVATHSRIVFENEFLAKTQFLVWENGKIVLKNKPTDDIKSKIGGDALQLVTALDINKAVFYVEDDTHKQILDFLVNHFSKNAIVVEAGSKSNVQNLCRYLTKEEYSNAYFVVDGDNQGKNVEFQKNDNYIQLSKYCIENYFFDYSVLAKAADVTQKEVKKTILQEIKEAQEDQHTKVFKALANNSNISPDVLDTYNAKKIFSQVASKLGFSNQNDLVIKFLVKSKEKNELERIFSEITEKLKAI